MCEHQWMINEQTLTSDPISDCAADLLLPLYTAVKHVIPTPGNSNVISLQNNLLKETGNRNMNSLIPNCI